MEIVSAVSRIIYAHASIISRVMSLEGFARVTDAECECYSLPSFVTPASPLVSFSPVVNSSRQIRDGYKEKKNKAYSYTYYNFR